MRYFLEIAYNGANFHGWQVQHNAYTIQEELEKALKKLFNDSVELTASGRTDTGVHALQQFAHLDVDKEFTLELLHKLNCMVSREIAILNAFRVKDDAHARFDATSRTYEYRICPNKDPFLKGLTLHYPKTLNVDLMNEAAQVFYKHTDYQSFSKVHTSVDHFLCTITHAGWQRQGKLLVFTVEANRFLRGMVRAIVGTLLEVGKEKLSIAEFEQIILSKDRKAAGMAVSPEGLFLTKVTYPKEIFL